MTMIFKSAFALMTVATLAACQSSVDGLAAKDLDAIKASSKTWVETYNQNDWDGLALLFSPEATMMPPNSPAVIGRAAIADWEAENESGFRIAFDIQEVEGSGDMAYVSGRSCVFIPIGDGEYGVDVGKFLEVRKKQADGQWLIEADIFNSDSAIGSELLNHCPFATKPSATNSALNKGD